MMIKSILTVAAAAAALTATPALAIDHIPVRIGDLNLGTEAGQVELSNRLQLAAWRVCREPTRQGHMFDAGVIACQEQTIASSRQRLASGGGQNYAAATLIVRAVR